MKPKYILLSVSALLVIFGWNVFLAQRDQKLFSAYEKEVKLLQYKNPNSTPLKEWCRLQAGWHPDCNNK